MNKTMIAVVLTLLIAGSGGYMLGKSSSDMDINDKDTQSSIEMMKEQSAHIQEMGKMMQSNSKFMQEMATKYKDATMMSNGKDLGAIGEKYMRLDVDATKSSDSMKNMMGY